MGQQPLATTDPLLSRLAELWPSLSAKHPSLIVGNPDAFADVTAEPVVFTIPKRLRIYCRYDRSLLGGQMKIVSFIERRCQPAAVFGRCDPSALPVRAEIVTDQPTCGDFRLKPSFRP